MIITLCRITEIIRHGFSMGWVGTVGYDFWRQVWDD